MLNYLDRTGLFLPICLAFTPLLWAQDNPRLINITTLEQLSAVRCDLNGDGRTDIPTLEADYERIFRGVTTICPEGCLGYELTRNLDFEDDDSYSSGARNLSWVDPARGGTDGTPGWEPIAWKLFSRYEAVFDGRGCSISNLYVHRDDYVGLFASVGVDGELCNLSLDGGTVTGGGIVTGGLVGWNYGLIMASHSSVRVVGTGANFHSTSFSAGGLVGWNYGTITTSHSFGRVQSGGAYTGGLVGQNDGAITVSYSYGHVASRGNYTGGFGGVE